MRIYTFDNGLTIDLDKVESVSKPIKKDPYNETYGAHYYITMVSGIAHEAYEYVKGSAPTFGNIVMSRVELINLLTIFK